jgi:hypothetical protein
VEVPPYGPASSVSARAEPDIARAYLLQKQRLEAETGDDGPFVASLRVVRRPDGRIFAMAVLTADLPTLLPACDVVGLVRVDDQLESSEILGYVDFDTLLAYFGPRAVPMGLEPERWQIETPLSPDELRALAPREGP